MDTNLVSKNLNWDAFENRQKKFRFFFKLEKKFDFFSTFKSIKSPVSGKEIVRFRDSPDRT